MLKKIISMALISSALVSVIPASAAWKQVGTDYNYINKDGSKATGWKYIDGNWYLFDYNGVRQTGWKQDGDAWYYFWSNGMMATNSWIKSYDTIYYVGEDGKKINDYKVMDKTKYELDIAGSVLSYPEK